MICFSRNDLERIGKKVTVAYMRSREVSEDDVYQVDPEQVAQDLFHLSLAHFHLSSDRTVLGMTSSDEYWVEVFDEHMESKFCCLDGKTILIEQDLLSETVPLGRYNFTVMHEVAHQILFFIRLVRDRKSSSGNIPPVREIGWNGKRTRWQRPY